jgi:hypothetical protein
VKQVLQAAYPGKGIGGGIRYSKSEGKHVESVREAGAPPAVLEKCITQLGMTPIPAAQSLIDNAESQISLGTIVPQKEDLCVLFAPTFLMSVPSLCWQMAVSFSSENGVISWACTGQV